MVQRKEALERAAKLQSDQTEKMKIYRSHKLCAEVLDTVAEQQREKLRRNEQKQKEKDAYHQLILQQVQAAGDMEKRKMERKQDITRSVAQTRIQQRSEAQDKYNKEKQDQRLIGCALQQQVKQDLLDACQ